MKCPVASRKSDRHGRLPEQWSHYAQEAADEAAKQERIKKWETFCKPTRTYDSEGVIRLVYARKGCEFGRSE